MIADNELTGESLSQTINEIMDDEELQKQMCRASKEQGSLMLQNVFMT